MIKTDSWNRPLLQKLENRRNLGSVALGHGKPKSHLYPGISAVLQPLQGPFIRIRTPAKPVVGRSQPVYAYPDIGEPVLRQAFRYLPIYKGPVAGEYRPHAQFPGIFNKLKQIRSHQGLSAGEKQHRAAE